MSSDEALRVLKSHSASMRRTDPLPVNRRGIYLAAVRPLLERLNGELREALGDKTASQFSTRQPSLSASFEKTRGEGGQQAALSGIVRNCASELYEDVVQSLRDGGGLESEVDSDGDEPDCEHIPCAYDEREEVWYEPHIGDTYLDRSDLWIDEKAEKKIWTVADALLIRKINSDWLEHDHKCLYSDTIEHEGRVYSAFWTEKKLVDPRTGRYFSVYGNIEEPECEDLHSYREKPEAKLQCVRTDSEKLDAWTGNNYSKVLRSESAIYRQAQEESLEPHLEAQVAMVFEPLKVRVISKGPSASYYVAGPFQKKLHGLLKRIPCFRLIGRPASPTDLMDLIRTDKSLALFDLYSADYQTSTDRLSSGLSGDFMDVVTDGLKYAEVYKATLRPHKISYPEFRIRRSELDDFKSYLIRTFNATNDSQITSELFTECIDPNRPQGFRSNTRSYWVKVCLPSIVQVNGQLMGSPTSFPILCLGNLSGWLVAMCVVRDFEDIVERDATEEDGDLLRLCFERYDETRLDHGYIAYLMDKVLINGDDLASLMTKAEQLVFTWVGIEIGLELSVGKTYSHERYVNINSTCYDYNFRHGGVPVEIPYLNTGLFFGQNKVLCSTDTDGEEIRLATVAPHVVVIDRVVEGSLPGKQCDILAAYIAHWKRELPHECRGRNLFISRCLGGFGVKVPVGFEWKTTATQRCYAERRLRELGDYEPDQRPNFYMDRDFEPIAYIAPWWDRRKDATVPPRLPRAQNSGVGIAGIDLTLRYRQLQRPPYYTGVPTSWVSPDTAMRDFEL